MKKVDQASTQYALEALLSRLPAFSVPTQESLQEKSADELEALFESTRFLCKAAESLSVNLDRYLDFIREARNEKSEAERQKRRQSRD